MSEWGRWRWTHPQQIIIRRQMIMLSQGEILWSTLLQLHAPTSRCPTISTCHDGLHVRQAGRQAGNAPALQRITHQSNHLRLQRLTWPGRSIHISLRCCALRPLCTTCPRKSTQAMVYCFWTIKCYHIHHKPWYVDRRGLQRNASQHGTHQVRQRVPEIACPHKRTRP
jgi:hypothetical protein